MYMWKIKEIGHWQVKGAGKYGNRNSGEAAGL